MAKSRAFSAKPLKRTRPCGTSTRELVSRVDTAAARDEAQERSTSAQRGRRAMGKTLERRHKLRRESAVSYGFNDSKGRYGFTVGATPWRRLCASRHASVCGDERLVSLITTGYAGVTSRGPPRSDELLVLTVRESPWRAKPHGRYRHEIGPEVRARRKPSRGCETLRAERTRWGKPGWSGLAWAHASEGQETPWELLARAAPMPFGEVNLRVSDPTGSKPNGP